MKTAIGQILQVKMGRRGRGCKWEDNLDIPRVEARNDEIRARSWPCGTRKALTQELEKVASQKDLGGWFTWGRGQVRCRSTVGGFHFLEDTEHFGTWVAT